MYNLYGDKAYHKLVDEWGTRNPEREAIIDGRLRISYGQLNNEIHQLAAALFHLGVRKNDRIIILLPNWYEFIVLYMAIAKIGAVAVPCNCALTEKEIERRFHIIQPKAIFISNSSQLSWFKEKEFDLHIITTRFQEEGYYSYNDLLQIANLQELTVKGIHSEVKIDPKEDLFAILFTSGSTGDAKGVQLTAHSLFHSAGNTGCCINCSKEDIVLVPLPCGHAFGLLAGILMPLIFGAKIVLMEKHRSFEALSLIEQEKVTVHLGVPTMFIRELECFQEEKRDLSSLRVGIVAGASCSEFMMKQIETEFGMDMMNLYGSSEATCVSMTNVSDTPEQRLLTSGRALSGVEIKVLDGESSTVGVGVVGELAVKGEGLMTGYFKMPEKTAEVIDEEGWFHTGDLVTLDSFGYVKIVGRKKDLIIRGGNNIVPAEVEEVYFTHPSIKYVSVFGIPDNILGEQVCACVTLKEHGQETEETLKKYAIAKIAKYKIPDHILILDKMPKLPNGKINKRVLVEYFQSSLSPSGHCIDR